MLHSFPERPSLFCYFLQVGCHCTPYCNQRQCLLSGLLWMIGAALFHPRESVLLPVLREMNSELSKCGTNFSLSNEMAKMHLLATKLSLSEEYGERDEVEIAGRVGM